MRAQLTAKKPPVYQGTQKANSAHRKRFQPVNKEAAARRNEKQKKSDASLIRGDSGLSEEALQAKHMGGNQDGCTTITPMHRLAKGDEFSKMCKGEFIIADPINKMKFFCLCCVSRITNKMEAVRDHIGVDSKGRPKKKRGEHLGERHRIRR